MAEAQPSEIILSVRGLYEAVHRYDVIAAAALGINLTDLRCIDILGPGPLTPSVIGARVGLTSGSVTAMIDRLEKRGVLERRRAQHDRRSITVSLLPAFRQQAVSVFSILGDALQAEIEAVNAGGLDRTAALIRAISRGIETAASRLQDLPSGR